VRFQYFIMIVGGIVCALCSL